MSNFRKSRNLLVFKLVIVIAGCNPNNKNSSEVDTTAEEEQKHYVILMGGQSNMVGSGRVADLDSVNIPDHITYFNRGMKPNFSQDSLSFGPEIGLSQILHQHFPDSNFILVKYAIGGASLLDWAPDYDSAQATITRNVRFGVMYDSLWKYVSQATATVNEPTEIAALLWMQGERDARIPEAGVDYYPHFRTFIERIRQDADRPNLPIIFGLVNPDPARYAAVDTVQAAQRRIANEMDDVWMIDTSDLGKWDDNVHYNSAGQLELGQQFGQALVKYWKASAKN
ncbi:sialate O-acetylesterase [Tunicatimonas pelagia]|uniref:sialate O-acetylesterase n=1 Tax=Tunicatimonas pelagia TaxID=931531 RepID=UPI002666C1B9|nr:sialate O-acetylesterase [Tunicatimonas pelagia]WKN40430.1 sialate O-acetylesterase [Tunicatimonas pelagia]